jgi:Cu(I)/Ag(I) efflux system membrane protein CusA/SilA
MIRDEGGQLAADVYGDTEDRDVGGYVQRARNALAAGLILPPGYRLEWTGDYQRQLRASARLWLLVPLVLLVILVVLYVIFHSAAEALLVMLSVVYAMTGGVVLQWVLGQPFSVAVWVGYIGLFGVAVQTGVVMIVYLEEALEQRRRTSSKLTERDLFEAVIAGAVLRLRPKLMTIAATACGLLPLLWSTGAGTDLLKPMAVPIIGGMATSAVHVLIITPVIFYLMNRRQLVPLPAIPLA